MSRKLLREYYELCPGGICQDLLTEEEKKLVNSGVLILTGIMQKAEALNGNGRIYPKKVLEKELKNYQKLIKERRALGELDHPDDSVINLKNASHLVTDLWWEGEDVMGKIQILNTPSGQVLKALVEADVKLGISSRGLGTTKDKNGKTYVNNDFQLICFDVVSEPSTDGAFMVTENMERQLNNIFTKSDRINRALNDVLAGT